MAVSLTKDTSGVEEHAEMKKRKVEKVANRIISLFNIVRVIIGVNA